MWPRRCYARRARSDDGNIQDWSGVQYAIDPSRLFEEIIVSPYSPPWLLKVVQSTVAKFAVDVEIRESTLKQKPPNEFAAQITIRRCQVYFAIPEERTALIPLRIWAESRQVAFAVAREWWGLEDVRDGSFDVWTLNECVDQFGQPPVRFERASNPFNNKLQNSLDPEAADRGGSVN